jgi:serine/threonine-protein kinase HipA
MEHHIDILMSDECIGVLTYDAKLHQFSFNYDTAWLCRDDRFQLNSQIPFDPIPEISKEMHSALVKQFFENLLPEGQALDDAANMHNLSKSNLMAMLMAIGKETSGALSVGGNNQKNTLRELPFRELSERIRLRPFQPFTVWDGKVRLSIAGFQDKIAAMLMDGKWYLTEGPIYASTHIMKPEPVSDVMRGMTSNEFFCMRLAERIRLNVAPVTLIHVPEPMLVITRFDRHPSQAGVKRLHYIDGCQALSLPVNYKYERNFGSGIDVAHIRDGASYPKLFELININTPTPAKQRLMLLRWAIYQVLIGNVDAHAKNLSFSSSSAGLKLAPAYDLVSGASFSEKNFDRSYAMAIGDAFLADDLSPYEWANFANACNLPFSLVSTILKQESEKVLKAVDYVFREVVDEGADAEHVQRVVTTVKAECQRQLSMAVDVKKVNKDLF